MGRECVNLSRLSNWTPTHSPDACPLWPAFSASLHALLVVAIHSRFPIYGDPLCLPERACVTAGFSPAMCRVFLWCVSPSPIAHAHPLALLSGPVLPNASPRHPDPTSAPPRPVLAPSTCGTICPMAECRHKPILKPRLQRRAARLGDFRPTRNMARSVVCPGGLSFPVLKGIS